MAILENIRDRTFYFFYRRRQTFINLGVILGLIAAAFLVGRVMKPGSRMIEFGLVGVAGILAGFLLYRMGRMEYGILLIPITAGLLNFYTLPTGTMSRIVISLVVALSLIGLWFLQLIVARDKENIKPSSINLPTLLFIVVSVIAYIWSIFMRDPLVITWDSFPMVQLAALAVNILLPLVGLLVANKINEVVWLRYLTWIMIFLGAFVIISTYLNLPFDRLYFNGSRGLFVTWVGSLAYAMALFNDELDNWKRGLLLVLVAAWLYHDFIQHSAWLSGWVPLGISLAALTFFRSRRLFLMAVVVGLIILAVDFNRYYEGIYVANVEEGSSRRLQLWTRNLRLVSRHPLFGVGPAGYAVYYMTYHPQDARSTHNNYFDILAQTGVTGFAIFLWLFGAYMLTGNESRRVLEGRRNFEEAFANAVLTGSIATSAAMMLGDWVLPFAYNQTIIGFDNASYTWLFMGAMVAFNHILRRRDEI